MKPDKRKLKKIAFMCYGFPIISETFITNQVISAHNLGYNVEIHANYQYELEISIYIDSDFLRQSIYIKHDMPSGKLRRFIAAFELAKKNKSLISLVRSMNPLKFGSKALNLRNFFSLTSFLVSGKPNLIHAHFGPNGIKAVNARRCGLVNCPIITSFHGYDAFAQERDLPALRKKYHNLFEHGELFLVNSNFLHNQLVNLGCTPSKIVKIPLGVNTNLFKPAKVLNVEIGKQIKLITTGRLIELKNQRFGILILSWLIEAGLDASYTLIGSGPELQNLNLLAEKLGIQDHVIFAGNKSPDEIAKILPQHHIFLMTSNHDGEGRTETQGIVTAEAQSCGLPVLAFGAGGTKETIQEGVTGYIIGEKSKQYVVELVTELIQPENYRRLSANARHYILNYYNIDETNRKLDEIYNNYC